MMLLKIGDIDFSSYVNRKKYEANQEDETVSWKDANSVIHTTVVRTRINADVELIFSSERQHIDFVSALASACVDGYWNIVLYVNNLHDFRTIRARIDMTARKTLFGNVLVDGRPVVNAVRLNIEEA